MKTFTCACGNRLFFANIECTTCGRLVGYWHNIRAVIPLEQAQTFDAWPDWRIHAGALPEVATQLFVLDQNRRQFGVGNELIAWDPDDPRAAPQQPMEAAKRRLLYTVDQLAIPYGLAPDDPLPLRFEFLADPPHGPPISTGHANGTITINVAEADPVERERLRVCLGEPQRTLIGHLRHEFAHYTWQRLVLGRDEENFIARFGDYNNPSYSDARDVYYRQGPPSDWRSRFVSAYAAMHPWEDFAETFACFLDMYDTLETAHHLRISDFDPQGSRGDLHASVRAYANLGIAINEINRGMGLLDLVPEILAPPVIDKMCYICRLVGFGT